METIMKKHATALRAFSHADKSFAKGQTILGMDPRQFADWSAEGVDLVREATDKEVAAARGDKAPAAEKAPTKPVKAGPVPKAPPAPAPAPVAPAAPEPAA
jgi:hypothetical protein